MLRAALTVTGKITGYGIVRVPAEYKTVNAPDTAARAAREFLKEPVLLRTTNRIPAKIGTWFGIFYQIHLPTGTGETEVLHVTTSPGIRRPDGTVSHGYERKGKVGIKGWQAAGTFASFIGFGFDRAYEMVPGKWTLEVRFRGRTLCKQDFQVTRE
jgi:hypothetical protein